MEPTNFAYVIKQLELALRPQFLDACTAAGMTWVQYTALTVLDRRPGITSSELARRSFVSAQSMAQTLDPLLQAGFVRRERDPEHARRMLLFLTDRGLAAIEDSAPRLRAIEERLLRGFDADERRTFAEFLRRARRSFEETALVEAE